MSLSAVHEELTDILYEMEHKDMNFTAMYFVPNSNGEMEQVSEQRYKEVIGDE